MEVKNPYPMALTIEQQAIELISRAKHILVITKELPSTDAISATVGLGLLLQKLNKTFDAIIPGAPETTPVIPSFLPQTIELQSTVGAMRTFQLQVNVEQTPLSELMYDVQEGKLHISLIPKRGEWSPSDITFKSGQDRYDLVIALDCPDRQSLGALARTHADFLYRTPIINLDHHANNEYWGQLNMVDLTAVSTTEVVYRWLEQWNKNLMDEPMATALLAGMIAATKSFRTNNVTPRTLTAAAELVFLGAEREKIIHGLWRTRSLNTLKIWGRALSRLEQDVSLGFLWMRLSQSDFLEAGTSPEALDGVVDELISYAPEARAIAVISQLNSERLLVHLHTTPPLSAAELARPFGGQGTHERATFEIPATDLTTGSTQTIERLRSHLQNLQ